MITTISGPDFRSFKAAEIAATAGQWLKCRTADGSKRYGVPSQSVAGLYYLADTRFCACPDFQRRGGPCKHVLAVRTWVAQVRASQAQGEAA